MKVQTLMIHWHADNQPIYSGHFKPGPRGNNKLATAGGDNNVRLWQIDFDKQHNPKVTYLATLAKHTQAVNVVRFDPTGEMLATAGDDGNIILWVPSEINSKEFGAEWDDKETWRIKHACRSNMSEIYDLAWSPDSQYFITGSMDNIARIYSAETGSCIRQIAEHNHYVQGVAWDPLNSFIATQSADRSVHIYTLKTKDGKFILNPHQKITRADLPYRRLTSPAPSTFHSNKDINNQPSFHSSSSKQSTNQLSPSLKQKPTTPSTSLKQNTNPSVTYFSLKQNSTHQSSTPSSPLQSPSTPNTSSMNPPPQKTSHSRHSSFGSSHSFRGRSPSPVSLPLPAVRPLDSPKATQFRSSFLYHGESFASFFRRLTFTIDGSLLITPAGQYKYSLHSHPNNNLHPNQNSTASPFTSVSHSNTQTHSTTSSSAPSFSSSSPPSVSHNTTNKESPGFNTTPVEPSTPISNTSSATINDDILSNTVFIYTRAGLNRAPVAFLPGLKEPSVAVKCSPIRYKLREQSSVNPLYQETEKFLINSDGQVTPELIQDKERNRLKFSTTSSRPPVFQLPYRLVYAVATQDSVLIYDTQQSSPICIITDLHYATFTDLTWSPDGNNLVMTSTDGFCSIVAFEPNEIGECYTGKTLIEEDSGRPMSAGGTPLKENNHSINSSIISYSAPISTLPITSSPKISSSSRHQSPQPSFLGNRGGTPLLSSTAEELDLITPKISCMPSPTISNTSSFYREGSYMSDNSEKDFSSGSKSINIPSFTSSTSSNNSGNAASGKSKSSSNSQSLKHSNVTEDGSSDDSNKNFSLNNNLKSDSKESSETGKKRRRIVPILISKP